MEKYNIAFISPFIANILLAFTFLRTLSQGKEALITIIARINYDGNISGEMKNYTRNLTLIWGIYFILAALLSVLLMQRILFGYISAVWNLLFLFLPVTLFTVEFLYRMYRFPNLPHAGPLRIYRIIRKEKLFKKGRSR